jgi:uncharacterized protein YaaQ
MAADTQYKMLIAIVQAQDADIASEALEGFGAQVIRLPSMGGFLGRRNATLIAGIPLTAEEQAIQLLRKNCRQRVEYISIPLESAPLPLPAPTPVTIGGAAIFSLEVEHFEEI